MFFFLITKEHVKKRLTVKFKTKGCRLFMLNKFNETIEKLLTPYAIYRIKCQLSSLLSGLFSLIVLFYLLLFATNTMPNRFINVYNLLTITGCFFVTYFFWKLSNKLFNQILNINQNSALEAIKVSYPNSIVKTDGRTIEVSSYPCMFAKRM